MSHEMPHRPAPSGRRRWAARWPAVTVLATVAVVGLAASASAHVTVEADDPRQGAADTILTFRIPDEDAAATTVKVAISFPRRTPLASVRPAAKPGWTVTTSRTTFSPPITTDDGTISEGVSQVVYTAASPAAGIPVGGFDTFQILVGPLPHDATTLAFPTVQTYSNGRSSSWIEPVTDPANEPENPAPTLTLLPAAAPRTWLASGAAPARPSVNAGATAVDVATSGEVSTARTLALAAVVLAALGLLAAAGAVVLSTRRRAG